MFRFRIVNLTLLFIGILCIEKYAYSSAKDIVEKVEKNKFTNLFTKDLPPIDLTDMPKALEEFNTIMPKEYIEKYKVKIGFTSLKALFPHVSNLINQLVIESEAVNIRRPKFYFIGGGMYPVYVIAKSLYAGKPLEKRIHFLFASSAGGMYTESNHQNLINYLSKVITPASNIFLIDTIHEAKRKKIHGLLKLATAISESIKRVGFVIPVGTVELNVHRHRKAFWNHFGYRANSFQDFFTLLKLYKNNDNFDIYPYLRSTLLHEKGLDTAYRLPRWGHYLGHTYVSKFKIREYVKYSKFVAGVPALEKSLYRELKKNNKWEELIKFIVFRYNFLSELVVLAEAASEYHFVEEDVLTAIYVDTNTAQTFSVLNRYVTALLYPRSYEKYLPKVKAKYEKIYLPKIIEKFGAPANSLRVSSNSSTEYIKVLQNSFSKKQIGLVAPQVWLNLMDEKQRKQCKYLMDNKLIFANKELRFIIDRPFSGPEISTREKFCSG